MTSGKKLEKVLDALEAFYGKPDRMPTNDPFELILWENVVYLADDVKRKQAFDELRKSVGLAPQRILDAPREVLLEITGSAGILSEQQVEKLLDIARITQLKFNSDLNRVVELPLKEAIKSLKAFPSIGEPGAEKILLFSHSRPLPALESNGLRVLVRLGFGEENKNYSTTYKSVQQAIKPQIKQDCDWLIRAHQLLRQHGHMLCKRTRPLCPKCPVNRLCLYGTIGKHKRTSTKPFVKQRARRPAPQK